MRPWFLTLAMSLTWIVGVFGATSGCSDVSFLRGSREMPRFVRKQSQAGDHPVMRSSAVAQQARLEAVRSIHQRLFPLSLAKLMLAIGLVLVSGAAMAGRRGAQRLALQMITANAVLAAVYFGLTAPVRDAVAMAMATDAVDHGSSLPNMSRAESIELLRHVYQGMDWLRLGILEVAIFGGAAVALTRERTQRYFDAVAETLRDEQARDE